MIAHFDLDAFFAAVAIRENPSLRGKPVAVAGSHRRSVVLTASYEARPFGVRSAIPLYRALERCPQLIVVSPTMELYKEVSREVFAIFSAHAQAVEGLSLDEAFLDLPTDDIEAAVRLAQSVRAEIVAKTQLTASAGIATSKLTAKIASDLCKPNGLLAVKPGEEAAFLAPLAVGKLWGVGPKTEARLQSFGIRSIGDVAALDESRARSLFGSSATQMRELALGIDPRPVHAEREIKSISTEETFDYDVSDERILLRLLREQAREIAERLAREDVSAQVIGIKIKHADFRVAGRQTHLREPTRDAARIFAASRACLRRLALGGQAIRLLGTRCAELSSGSALQLTLFDRGQAMPS